LFIQLYIAKVPIGSGENFPDPQPRRQVHDTNEPSYITHNFNWQRTPKSLSDAAIPTIRTTRNAAVCIFTLSPVSYCGPVVEVSTFYRGQLVGRYWLIRSLLSSFDYRDALPYCYGTLLLILNKIK